MGLAASQARLLSITARKADCEFQSMSLSHQKMALARDMENVSDEYQNALNATKLVYDYYGTGDSDMSFTYGLMMQPSIYNDYYPKLVTDAKNKVLLDSTYAAAARAAGIPAEGFSGTPSSDVRNKFIEALVGTNTISSVQAAAIEGITYDNLVGLGSTRSITIGETEVTYDELMKLFENAETAEEYGITNFGKGQTGYNEEGYKQTSAGSNVWAGRAILVDTYKDTYNTSDRVKKQKEMNIRYTARTAGDLALGSLAATAIAPGVGLAAAAGTAAVATLLSSAAVASAIPVVGWAVGAACAVAASVFAGVKAIKNLRNKHKDQGPYEYPYNQSTTETISIKNLLDENHHQALLYKDACDANPTNGAQWIIDTMLGDGTEANTGVLGWMDDQFKSVLGGNAVNDLALEYAYQTVANLISNGESFTEDEGNGYDSYSKLAKVATEVDYCKAKSAVKEYYDGKVYAASQDYVGMVFSCNKSNRSKSGACTSIALDLNNIARAYLTAFVQFAKGDMDESAYKTGIGKIGEASKLYQGEDGSDDFKFTVTTDAEVEEDHDLYAQFYDAMFNQLCTKGWVENDMINDDAYMAEMMKNGMAYISSINEDGYYYQKTYSTDNSVLEVRDDEAIAKAEAKYNAEKAKIENKEDTIDMKMRNLDTEISSLTTEYDTVKSTISKAIEKSFKRYDA